MASTTTTTDDNNTAPKILKDPRFRAGRKLIQSGRDGAIDLFGTLLEEARTKYGENSIETAPAYFEYGNALFRESQRQQAQGGDDPAGEQEEEQEDGESGEKDGDKKPAAVEKETEQEGSVEGGGASEDKGEQNGDEQEEDDDAAQNEQEQQVEDDAHLALTMMETAFAILDNYVQSAAQVVGDGTTNTAALYLPWAQRESLPRVLSSIGDVLSSLERHADAADVYTRALQCREDNLELYDNSEEEKDKRMSCTLQALVDRRKATEANMLVAEELLACPLGQDVVTTETQSVLVKGSEVLQFITGYYEKARDQLQEAVYLMATLAAKGNVDKDAFNVEKENVCFASTLLMGVGEQVAARENDEQQQQEQADSVEPVKKRAKK